MPHGGLRMTITGLGRSSARRVNMGNFRGASGLTRVVTNGARWLSSQSTSDFGFKDVPRGDKQDMVREVFSKVNR